MVSYYVVSPSRMVRIPCQGPLDAQHEKEQLEEQLKRSGLTSDVEIRIETAKKPAPRARPESGHKRSTKLRSK